MTLQSLKQDLIDKWLTIYDAFPGPDAPQDKIKEIVYAESSRFPLDKYNPEQFLPAGPVSSTALPGGVYAYYLNDAGKPLFLTVKDAGGKDVMRGHYNYSDSLVEYIEFNLQSRLPSCIQYIVYEGNKRVNYQSLTLEGRGVGENFGNTPKAKILTALMEREMLGEFKLYHYTDNRIAQADSLQMLPGDEDLISKEHYRYDQAGQLEEIMAEFEDGATSYLYVKKPDNVSLQELSDMVASQMAKDIISAIEETGLKDAIAAVELNYQEVNQYTPYVCVVTEPQRASIESAASKGSFYEDWVSYPEKEDVMIYGMPFERLLVAFMAEVEALNDYAIATNMIRTVARILNENKLDGKMPVSSSFMAYAVDMEMSGDFIEILEACGVAPAMVAKWETLYSAS